jgi:hypothetical protein
MPFWVQPTDSDDDVRPIEWHDEDKVGCNDCEVVVANAEDPPCVYECVDNAQNVLFALGPVRS